MTRTARDLLQAIVRGEAQVADVGLLLRGVRQEPVATADGLTWEVLAPEYRLLAVRAALAWAALHETSPGRLRPCANNGVPTVPARPQQGQHRPLVLDGPVRQPAQGATPLQPVAGARGDRHRRLSGVEALVSVGTARRG